MTKPERALLRAWALLMGLSVALAVATEIHRPADLVLAWTAFVGAVAFVKARIVLAHYLGLRTAPGALSAFAAAVAIILVAVVASFGLQQLLAALQA